MSKSCIGGDPVELFPTLFGNEKLKKTVALDILSGKASHAYIFEGPEGSGKHTAALCTAAAMFCEHKDKAGLKKFPCGECPSCKKVFSGECVDVVTLGSGEKATIGVDSVRRAIKSSLHFSPTEMSHKIFIIEDADKMTPQAQNALLIPMEEAPPFVMFLILCSDALSLLETVRSRAPVIRTEIFSNDAVRDYLMSSESLKKVGDADKAAALSGGKIGCAVRLLASPDKTEDAKREKFEKAVKLFCTGSAAEKIDFMSGFYKAPRAEVLDLIGNIKTALRDILCVKKSSNPCLLFYTDKKTPAELSSKVSTRRICELWEIFTSAQSDINANVGIPAVLTLLCTK